MLNIIELKEIAYTELILSIDVKTRNDKFDFNIVKGYKTKYYPDGYAASSWEQLKNKYEPLLPLLCFSWTRNSDNHLLWKVKILKCRLLSKKI